MKLTDESLMPMGKHAGKKMGNIPCYYLQWFKTYVAPNYENQKIHD